jgi:hypothetical protein
MNVDTVPHIVVQRVSSFFSIGTSFAQLSDTASLNDFWLKRIDSFDLVQGNVF